MTSEIEAQLEGERRANSSEEEAVEIGRVMPQPAFAFEIREHIAFCFTCTGRSLDPQEQAALVLKEVLGLRNEEGAGVLGVSKTAGVFVSPESIVRSVDPSAGRTRQEEG